ncbi:MAG TPA: M20/M25/M40 family metallo-hydrolase [Pirellulaceae bacterium]|nr:M20/M25/M40 family metallo-hydrolase [Pirellulaceae bacterium]
MLPSRTARWSFVALFLAALALRSASAAETTAEASEARLQSHASHLASDALEGRGIGTKGLDQAADFLAAEFAKAGLKTDLFEGTPFQKFTVTTNVELGAPANNKLVLVGPPEKEGAEPRRIELELGKTFNPLAVGGSGKVTAPLVFVGYGITAKDLKDGVVYDEYEGLDVQGKIVVLIRKEPQQEQQDSVFNGTQPSRHAFFPTKISNAFEHGAAAVIMFNDGLELANRANDNKKMFDETIDRLVEARRKFKEQSDPSAADRQKHAAEIGQLAEQIAALSKQQSDGPDAILPFNGAGTEGGRRNSPVLFCSRLTMDKVISAALGKDLAAIEKEIDASLTPQSKELAGWSAEIEAEVITKEAEVKNVVGVLEGEGPLADETIIVGAHYDHLGMGGAGSLAPWTAAIHNGADDNASGTATLLEIAHRLATSDKKPQRRIVFIAFTGEEKGLLGSAHYVRQPRFPLEKTIAMYNLDMVGRLKDEKLIVYGTGTAAHFDALVEGLCKDLGFKLTKHPGGLGPSDHSSFYARKIPVLHFFTGTHSDYHRPSDDAEKLNVAGMRRIADMVVRIVEKTDAEATPPKYVEIKKMETIALDPSAGGRPSLGTIPDYSAAADGVALTGVVPGSAAEKAGVKPGDVLTQLGDSKIAVIEDFENALRKHKPGDKVKLVVKRGDKTLELEATLTARRGP